MRPAPALLLVAAPLAAACTPMPAERPVEVLLVNASASPPPPPPTAPPPLASPSSSFSLHSQPADPQWKRRCAAFIQQGLTAAAVQEPALKAAVVTTSDIDEVSVSNPLGFFLGVRRNAAENATKDPPGIWQHRAESLYGSYHVMFIKNAGVVSASLAFDGWPSPRVEPLVPILHAAIDRCFPPR